MARFMWLSFATSCAILSSLCRRRLSLLAVAQHFPLRQGTASQVQEKVRKIEIAFGAQMTAKDTASLQQLLASLKDPDDRMLVVQM